ncbi:hypothetical protein GC177_03855 [bacterium]|nr:hypothetical protein [bacterium]
MRINGLGLVSALGLAVCLAASPVLAKDGHGNGKGHGKGHKSLEKRLEEYDRRHADDHQHGDYHGDRRLVVLKGDEREAIGNRLRPYYREHCPPGLAKKYGCMPPGHVKHYVVGEVLPATTTYWEVPRDVVVMLPPPPPRAQYIWVDKDILLISEATKKVLDAAVILSALE